jgi:hypothetical protein
VHWLLLLKGIGAVEALRPPQKSGGGVPVRFKTFSFAEYKFK